MTDRANAWSITINNPTSTDEEEIALARQKGWKVEGQLEQGKEGTTHYQLMVKTPQVRFSAMKKAFPRAHIEAARNVAALATYVSKEDTRVAPLAIAQSRYPSGSALYGLLYDYFEKQNYLDVTQVHLHRIKWWSKEIGRKTALDLLDEATSQLITDGYFVEALVVNPQLRSSWDKFHTAILYRTYADRQTDRQSCVQNGEEVIVPVDITTDGSCLQED